MDTINWINNIAKIKENVTVSQLILPGSHNSASYQVRPGRRVKSMTLDSSAVYQSDTIYDQLKKGVRFLHIRVLLDKRTQRLRTYSKSQNVDFDTVLKQIKAFSLISKDIVFIRLIAHDPAAATSLKNVIGMAFGNASVEYTDANLLLKAMPKDLMTAGKRVVLLGCDVRVTHLEKIRSDGPQATNGRSFDALLYQKRPLISFKGREEFKVRTNETFHKFAAGYDGLKQINTVLFDFVTSNDNIAQMILMSYLRCGIIR